MRLVFDIVEIQPGVINVKTSGAGIASKLEHEYCVLIARPVDEKLRQHTAGVGGRSVGQFNIQSLEIPQG